MNIVVLSFLLSVNTINALGNPNINVEHRKEVSCLSQKTQEIYQDNRPYGYECLKYQEILYVYKFEASNKKYNLIFASNGQMNSVNYVYIIPIDSQGSSNNTIWPPEIMQLRHHDIGENDFCGAIIDEDLEKNGKYRGTLRYEMKLPDEVAQKVVDLVTGHSTYKNKTAIKIKTVDYPNLHPIKLYD